MPDYLELAQNGARILFDLDLYRVVDGVHDLEQTYFIMDFRYCNPPVYQISLRDCYELISMQLCGVSKQTIIEYIEEIIEDVE
jgi:hypothetical protein